MSDYISREALINKLRSDPLFDLVERYNLTGVINSIQAADVRPVVRGKWEEVEVVHAENIDPYPDLATMRCGKCNRYHTTVFFYGNPTALMNFCPVCGADMRAES